MIMIKMLKMFKRAISLIAILALWASCSIATAEAPATSSMPATCSMPATSSAPARLSAKLNGILDLLEQHGKKIKDLKARIRHELYEAIPDARQVQLGVVMFKRLEKQQTAKFMVRFDSKKVDRLTLKEKVWFCFNGQEIREIRQRTKSVIDRQVVQPGEKNIDPFKIGQGPFPLPFGQSKADILANFTVKLLPGAKTDPPNTDHLLLVPLPKSKLKKQYTKIEFWIDRKSHLPVRIVTHDRHDVIVTVDFNDIELNTGITDSQLWVKVPPGYSYSKEKL